MGCASCALQACCARLIAHMLPRTPLSRPQEPSVRAADRRRWSYGSSAGTPDPAYESWIMPPKSPGLLILVCFLWKTIENTPSFGECNIANISWNSWKFLEFLQDFERSNSIPLDQYRCKTRPTCKKRFLLMVIDICYWDAVFVALCYVRWVECYFNKNKLIQLAPFVKSVLLMGLNYWWWMWIIPALLTF